MGAHLSSSPSLLSFSKRNSSKKCSWQRVSEADASGFEPGPSVLCVKTQSRVLVCKQRRAMAAKYIFKSSGKCLSIAGSRESASKKFSLCSNTPRASGSCQCHGHGCYNLRVWCHSNQHRPTKQQK